MEHPEHFEQVALIKWADYQTIPHTDEKVGLYLFAIANGGARNIVTGAMLKSEGVRKGVPDLFFVYPSAKHSGLFIEMKAPVKTARVSKEQRVWIERLNKCGYLAQVAYGFDEARQIILDYLENKI